MYFESILAIIIIILGLLVFTIITWRRLNWGLALIVLFLPLYLLRLKIGWIPTTVLELMIYLSFIIWLIKKILAKEKTADWLSNSLAYIPAIGLLFLGAVISTLVSPDKTASLGILKGWFIDPLLFFLVVGSVIKTKKQIKEILSAFCLSGLAVAVISFYYYIAGDLTFDGRLRAFYLSPNHLAMYLAPAIVILIGSLIFSKRRGLGYKILSGLALLICLGSLYLTYSYGTWLAIVIALFFLLFFTKHRWWYWLASLGVLVIAFLSQLSGQKLQDLLLFQRSSFQSRLMIWKSALLILKDHAFWGIGLGRFQEVYLSYQDKFPIPYLEWAVPQPHNIFLAFWLQCGILGLIGFIWILVKFFKQGFRSLTSGRWLPIILMAVMVYTLVHGIIDTTYWKNDLSVIFWLVVGLMTVKR